jgi:transcriptional regulator with XRE-family HTH domain
MRFQDKLQLLLVRKGFTQESLAAALKLNQSSVSRWLNGAVPHRRTVILLSDLLGVTADQLLNDDEHIPGIGGPSLYEPGFDAHHTPGQSPDVGTTGPPKLQPLEDRAVRERQPSYNETDPRRLTDRELLEKILALLERIDRKMEER